MERKGRGEEEEVVGRRRNKAEEKMGKRKMHHKAPDTQAKKVCKNKKDQSVRIAVGVGYSRG